jgi:ubiquinone/menaquinone biosynthesis C-methylase UbiE
LILYWGKQILFCIGTDCHGYQYFKEKPLFKRMQEDVTDDLPNDLSDPPMAPQIYDLVDTLADRYWRYVARHEAFATLWERYRQPQTTYRVLDVGCGTGGLLGYLTKRAPTVPIGIDLFAGTLPYCRRRGINSVSVADAIALPFHDAAFDFVVAQDVIEHVQDDHAALMEIRRVCAPGGMVLILVPAFEFLWSSRDVQLNHHRRYTVDQMARIIEASGFSVLHRTYTDLWLLPLLWAAIKTAPRTADGLADLPSDAAPGQAQWINSLLLTVSRLESAFATNLGLPFGVSAVVLARRPAI